MITIAVARMGCGGSAPIKPIQSSHSAVVGVTKRASIDSRSGSDLSSSDISGESSSLAPSVSQGTDFRADTKKAAKTASKKSSKLGDSSIDDIELTSQDSKALKKGQVMHPSVSTTMSTASDGKSDHSGDSKRPMNIKPKRSKASSAGGSKKKKK